MSRHSCVSSSHFRRDTRRAAAVEEQLRQIADEQHTNVNKLVDLVKENEMIISTQKVCVTWNGLHLIFLYIISRSSNPIFLYSLTGG